MADPFVAEIRAFSFNFAPAGWALCNGQLLSISQNTALFSLLGTNYGGDGRTTFGLPNLQGCAAMHPGQGPGLSLHDLGETGGSEMVTLLASEIPVHAHTMQGSGDVADNNLPTNAMPAKPLGRGNGLYSASAPATDMHPQAIAPSGGNQPHSNMMPYLTLNFCIATQGVFPPRG